MIKEVSILGYGHIGIRLGQSLIKKGHVVHASTTTLEKKTLIQSHGAQAYLINLIDKDFSLSNNQFFSSDVVILSFPPSFESKGAGHYQKLIEQACGQIKNFSIMISSISVFGDQQGQVNERSKPIPSTKSGEEILKAEEVFCQIMGDRGSILRLGGIVDEIRNPIRWLNRGMKSVDKNAPINFIHSQDVVGLLEKMIYGQLKNALIHGVCPDHILKGELYSKIAQKNNLMMPEFNELISKSFKLVEAHESQKLLSFSYKFPKISDFLLSLS